MKTFTPLTQKDLLIMKKYKELDELYQEIFANAMEYMKDYETQMVAGTLMAIAIRLYKTSLDDDEYKSMIQTVMDTEVKPYKGTKLH